MVLAREEKSRYLLADPRIYSINTKPHSGLSHERLIKIGMVHDSPNPNLEILY